MATTLESHLKSLPTYLLQSYPGFMAYGLTLGIEASMRHLQIPSPSSMENPVISIAVYGGLTTFTCGMFAFFEATYISLLNVFAPKREEAWNYSMAHFAKFLAGGVAGGATIAVGDYIAKNYF